MTVHACYTLSIHAGTAPACIPYFEGCTSISRAARYGLANSVFRAVMLPSAALIALFWTIAAAWLRAMPLAQARRIASMRAIGMIGALFLVLYVTFLGVEGDVYRWMRRYGVTVYFSFTVLAQMLLAASLPRGDLLRRRLGALCAAMLLLGLLSIPLQHLAEVREAALNAVEWIYALAMSSAFVLVGLRWRRERLRLVIA